MSAKLKVVIAGCGHIVEQWLKYAVAEPGLEICGLVDLKPEQARKWVDAFGLQNVQVGSDLAAILKATRADIVFDCTTPSAHTEVTLTALRHGCHVFGEKPMADSIANARRMVAAARQANRVYAVMQNRRFTPGIRTFSRVLASQAIGKLTTLHSTFLIGAHFWTFQNRMRHPLLLDMAIHTFDEARFISGAEPVSVFARDWKPEGCWFDGEASAVCFFEMTNGVVFSYRGSWCAEGFNTAWDAEWHAIATKGSARWDGLNAVSAQAAVKIPDGRPEEGIFSTLEPVEIPAVECLENGHHAWLDHTFAQLAKGERPETHCEDNIKSLAMVLSAIESSESNQTVAIPRDL